MHVFRQGQPLPAPAEAEKVVVAGRDEHRHLHLGKRKAERVLRLGPGAVAVEDVAGEQHQLRPRLRPQLGEGAQQRALLGAAQRGLLLGKALKGRVEVQVRGVEYAYHVYLTASTLRQAPVSESSSNTAPSSLAGPGAQS